MSLILFLKTTSVEKKGFFPGSGGVSTHTTTIHIILCVSCGHGNQTERKPIKSHQKFKLLHGRLFFWGMAAGTATKCNKKCPICCRWRHHQASSIQEAPARGLFTGLVYRKSYKLMFRNSEHSNKVIDSDIRSQKEGPSTLKKEILVV